MKRFSGCVNIDARGPGYQCPAQCADFPSRCARHNLSGLASSGRFELVTSTAQLDELRRVSRYPKLRAILPPHRIGAMVNNMQRSVVLEHLPNLPEGVELTDPDDAFLFTMALAGEADYLVTGDRRAGLLQRGSAGRARIVTPAIFCAEAL